MSSARNRGILRIGLPVLATVVVAAPLAWFWRASLTPPAYSVTDMGSADYGGGARSDADEHAGHGGHHRGPPTRSITELVADPRRPANVRVRLVARQEQLKVGGRTVAGYTVNGTSPGPRIRVRQGQLVEVRLRNESVAAGVALHWHGVDVPNAMDGVAGVTQDAVPVGGEFVYRFVAEQVGSYWYHSHQVSNPQVAGGLFGSLVVLPRTGIAQPVEVTALAHTYEGVRTLNGRAGDLRVPAPPGQRVRVRIANTDNAALEVWASAPFRLLAIDGTDLHKPTPVAGRALTLTAGARGDVEVEVPRSGSPVRLQVSKATAVVVGDGDAPSPPQPVEELDLLRYGSSAPLGFDPAAATRRFDYRIERLPGFVRRAAGHVVGDQRRAVPEHPDVHGPRGRCGQGKDREPQHRGAPDAPARASPGRVGPQRCDRDRESVVGRLATRPGR